MFSKPLIVAESSCVSQFNLQARQRNKLGRNILVVSAAQVVCVIVIKDLCARLKCQPEHSCVRKSRPDQHLSFPTVDINLDELWFREAELHVSRSWFSRLRTNDPRQAAKLWIE